MSSLWPQCPDDDDSRLMVWFAASSYCYCYWTATACWWFIRVIVGNAPAPALCCKSSTCAILALSYSAPCADIFPPVVMVVVPPSPVAAWE